MLHITLVEPVQLPAIDALGRTYFGFDPHRPDQENWQANRAEWRLDKRRAQRAGHVLFTEHATRTIVLAAKITDIITSPKDSSRKVIEGVVLGPGHPVYDEYVGQEQPQSARVRNPVRYLDA